MNENIFAQTAKMGTNIVPNFLQILVKILLKICNNNNQTSFFNVFNICHCLQFITSVSELADR